MGRDGGSGAGQEGSSAHSIDGAGADELVADGLDEIEAFEAMLALLQAGDTQLMLWEPDAIDDPGSLRIVASSHAVSPSTGVDMRPLIGRSIQESLPTLLETDAPATYLRALTEQTSQELPALTFGDETFPERIYRVVAHPVSDRLVGIVFSDVSRQVRAEKLYEDLYENALDMHATVDIHAGVVEMCNGTLARALGRAKDDIVGRTVVDLHADVCRSRVIAEFEKIAANQTVQNAELVLQREDGTTIEVLLNATPVQPGPGESARCRCTWRDVSERKEAEREVHRLNAELEQRVAARTRELERAKEEMESFAYSVSHDLRQPLRSMTGFSQALMEDYADQLDDDARDFLNRIASGAARMSDLVDGLLKLSRLGRQELTPRPVALAPIIEACAQELRRTYEHEVELVVAPDLKAFGDPSLLRVAFDNLLGNAWKFTKTTAAPRIEVGERDGAFYVADNGAGFDETYAHNLFVAFQRLHSADTYEGLGLGLATVKRIVERHHGKVWASGTPDEGATFYFTLDCSPATDSPATDSPATDSPATDSPAADSPATD